MLLERPTQMAVSLHLSGLLQTCYAEHQLVTTYI